MCISSKSPGVVLPNQRYEYVHKVLYSINQLTCQSLPVADNYVELHGISLSAQCDLWEHAKHSQCRWLFGIRRMNYALSLWKYMKMVGSDAVWGHLMLLCIVYVMSKCAQITG